MRKKKNFIWNKEELPQQWKESVILLFYKNGDKTDRSVYTCYPVFFCQGEIIGDKSADFSVD
jgi:hypothetical protein